MIRSLVLLALLSAPSLPAQQPGDGKAPQPTAPTRLRGDGNGFTLPAGDIGLTELIDAAAAFLNRNILANPAELQAGGPNSSITLQKQIVVDALGCEELLYGLLYMKGFAVVPLDAAKGFYEVINMSGPRAREILSRPVSRTPAEVLRRPTFKEYVLVSMQLQHINATVATAALRPFFSQAGGGGIGLVLGNVGNNRSLLLMGFGDQVAAALRMLQECDQPAPPDSQEFQVQQKLLELDNTVKQLQQQLQVLANAVAAGKPK